MSSVVLIGVCFSVKMALLRTPIHDSGMRRHVQNQTLVPAMLSYLSNPPVIKRVLSSPWSAREAQMGTNESHVFKKMLQFYPERTLVEKSLKSHASSRPPAESKGESPTKSTSSTLVSQYDRYSERMSMLKSGAVPVDKTVVKQSLVENQKEGVSTPSEISGEKNVAVESEPASAYFPHTPKSTPADTPGDGHHANAKACGDKHKNPKTGKQSTGPSPPELCQDKPCHRNGHCHWGQKPLFGQERRQREQQMKDYKKGLSNGTEGKGSGAGKPGSPNKPPGIKRNYWCRHLFTIDCDICTTGGKHNHGRPDSFELLQDQEKERLTPVIDSEPASYVDEALEQYESAVTNDRPPTQAELQRLCADVKAAHNKDKLAPSTYSSSSSSSTSSSSSSSYTMRADGDGDQAYEFIGPLEQEYVEAPEEPLPTKNADVPASAENQGSTPINNVTSLIEFVSRPVEAATCPSAAPLPSAPAGDPPAQCSTLSTTSSGAVPPTPAPPDETPAPCTTLSTADNAHGWLHRLRAHQSAQPPVEIITTRHLQWKGTGPLPKPTGETTTMPNTEGVSTVPAVKQSTVAKPAPVAAVAPPAIPAPPAAITAPPPIAPAPVPLLAVTVPAVPPPHVAVELELAETALLATRAKIAHIASECKWTDTHRVTLFVDVQGTTHAGDMSCGKKIKNFLLRAIMCCCCGKRKVKMRRNAVDVKNKSNDKTKFTKSKSLSVKFCCCFKSRVSEAPLKHYHNFEYDDSREADIYSAMYEFIHTHPKLYGRRGLDGTGAVMSSLEQFMEKLIATEHPDELKFMLDRPDVYTDTLIHCVNQFRIRAINVRSSVTNTPTFRMPPTSDSSLLTQQERERR
jgi:hypothetical protein